MSEERLSVIEDLLQSLDKRLRRVEVAAGLQVPSFKPTVQTPSETPSPRPPAPSTPSAPPPRPVTQVHEESFYPSSRPSSGGWLGAVGVLFFILAASFFVKLAIEAGWLTPRRQLAGLYIFGMSLIFIGFRLKSKDAAYASLLPGAGVVILYMAGYAGHLYYHLYGFVEATFITCAISGYSLFLFTFFKHEFFLIAAICGTYSVPLLIAKYNVPPIYIRTYFLIWDLVYASGALYLGRRNMIALAAYLAIGVSTITFWPESIRHDSAKLWPEVIFQTAQFVLLAVAVAIFSIKQHLPLTQREAWQFFPVLLLFYVIQYSNIEAINKDFAPFASLLFAAFLFGLYAYARKKIAASLPSTPVIAFAVSLFTLHALYLELLPDWTSPWFALALVVVFFILRDRLPYTTFWTTYLLLFGIFGYEYVALFEHSAHNRNFEHFILQFIYCSLFFALYYVREKENEVFILALAFAQGLSGLKLISEIIADSPADRYMASGLWAGLALGSILVAMKVRDRLLAKAAVAIFALVSVKVLFSDISSSGAITRVIGLVVIGALLYSGGLLLRQIDNWKE